MENKLHHFLPLGLQGGRRGLASTPLGESHQSKVCWNIGWPHPNHLGVSSMLRQTPFLGNNWVSVAISVEHGVTRFRSRGQSNTCAQTFLPLYQVTMFTLISLKPSQCNEQPFHARCMPVLQMLHFSPCLFWVLASVLRVFSYICTEDCFLFLI